MIPKLISRTCHETILWYHVKQNGSKTLHEKLTASSNPLVPCQTEWFQNYQWSICLDKLPLVPCQTEWFQNLVSSIQHDWS